MRKGWGCVSLCLATSVTYVSTLFSTTEGIPERVRQQYEDNLKWIEEAGRHGLVVGSQARILYSDQHGRVRLAQAFNMAVQTGALKVSWSLIFYFALID